MDGFRLTRLERQQILHGNVPKVIRETQPTVMPGDEVVVSWATARRYYDKVTEAVFGAPRQPSVWITVTKVGRHRKGGWLVRYDITDRRDPAFMLARGGGYTTDPGLAIDRNEADLSGADRKRLATEARAKAADDREKERELRKRQELAIRKRLTAALDGLDPQAQQILLASLERELIRVENTEAA